MKQLLTYIRLHREQVIVLADQGLASGVNFLVGVLLARYLGLEIYGVYVLVWMVVLFASSLQQAFVIKPLFTLYPKQTDQKQYVARLTGVQLILTLMIVLLSSGIVTVLAYFFSDWAIPGLALIIGFVSGLFLLNDYLRRLFFVQHQAATVLVMDIIGYGLQPVMIMLLIYNDALSIINALMGILMLLLGAIVYGWMKCRHQQIKFKGGQTVWSTHWQFSKFLIGTSVLQWVSGNLFIVVAGTVLGPMSIGAIRIVQNIMGVLHVLFLALENLIPIRASELYHTKGRQRMLGYFGKVTKQAAVPTLGVLLLIAIFSKEILELVYGQDFEHVQMLLVAFAGLYVLVFLGTIFQFIIRTIEQNQYIFISYATSSILSLLLAKPMVASMGMSGVILGLFIMQLVSLMVYFFSLKSDLKWIFKSYM